MVLVWRVSPGDTLIRFNELRRKVDGLSQKMLTQTLRSLEKDGFVHRAVEPTVPISVTYSLTPLGVSLNEPIKHVREWAMKRVGDIS
ncbi:transcriptional regulator [bacterium]|nr:MAG: transcriptional regulator [bacterium]